MGASFLSNFIKECFTIKFDEEPNYNKLHFILACELMKLDQVPNKDIFHSDVDSTDINMHRMISDINKSLAQQSEIDEMDVADEIAD
jgi:hypothetical protein